MIKSLLFGSEGSFHVCGFKVEFLKSQTSYYSFDTHHKNPVLSLLSKGAETCLNSRAFRILTLGYVHTFVHEMGHALAHKILTGDGAKIVIQTDTCKGVTSFRGCKRISKVAETIIGLSGALSDVVFSVCQIAAAWAMSCYITVPAAIAITIGAAVWIAGEFFYAGYSALQHDHGDFGKIAKNGPLHLTLALTPLVATVALGIIFTI